MSEASPTWGNDTEEAFFRQMRGCRSAYRRLGDAIHAVLGAHTAIEFGCGTADQTERLIGLGWKVEAFEYSPVARDLAEIPVEFFDLTSEKPLRAMADVAICTETAEHIPARFAKRIVDNVRSVAAKYIVWSAAPPGQEWPGHVNLRPAAYWEGMFEYAGWVVELEKTRQLRAAMLAIHAQHEYCRENFYIYVPA